MDNHSSFTETVLNSSNILSILDVVFTGDAWHLWVTTGEETGSASPGPVVLVLYGENGRSKPVYVADKPDFQFTEGSTEEFDIKVGNFIMKIVYIHFIHL